MEDLQQIINRIKESADIAEIISQYVELKNNKYGLCPFHNDHNPSLSVNQSGQYFHCFSCGKSGDVIKFIMGIENLSFMEAVKFLAKRYNITLASFTTDEKIKIEEKLLRSEILMETVNFYHSTLTEKEKQFLVEKWKFSIETINKYIIGFANGGLHQHLRDKNYNLEVCIKAGVLRQSETGEIRDFFTNRIIIPNFIRGSVVHIIGRSMVETKNKYLNLPGPIEYLFNEDCHSKNEVIIVEGPKDCITLLQNGFKAIGVYGTSSLHNKKIENILSRSTTPYLCLDGDEAGKKATREFSERYPDKLKIVTLPDGQDVNDYFQQHNYADFDKLLTEASDAVTYALENIPNDIHKEKLVHLLDPVIKMCTKLSEPMIEVKLNKIKEKFNLSAQEQKAYRDQIKKCKKDILSTKISNKENKTEALLAVNPPGVVDIVEDNNKLYFLKKEKDELTIVENIDLDGVLYNPPSKRDIPWLCPRATEVIKYFKEYMAGNQVEINNNIYLDVLEKLKSTSELPSDKYYLFMATWILHTYFIDQFQFSPIICLFAVPSTGKSRTGRGIINMSFHGLTRESARPANIIRDATDLKGSLFFDVSNFGKNVERTQSEDLILGRFEKGTKVSRVLFLDQGPFKDTVHYDIFGPTIIATNYPLDDKLDSRSITINMKDSKKNFNTDVNPENYVRLREKLTALRAKYFEYKLPEIDKPVSGRLGDIVKPLRQMVLLICPDLDEQFMSILKTIEEDRQNSISETVDARVLKSIYSMRKNLANGNLAVDLITQEFNQTLPDWEKKSNKSIGWRLRSLGMRKSKTNDGDAAIEYNTEQMELLMRKYGLESLLDNLRTNDPIPCPDNSNNKEADLDAYLDFPEALTGISGVSGL